MYKTIDKLIIIVTALLFATFKVYTETSLSTYGVLIATLLLFVLYLIKNNFRIPQKIYDFQILIILFIVFCLLSSLWATSSSDAITMCITVFEILICVSVVYYCFIQFDTLEPLLLSLVWGGYIISVVYFVSYGGLSLAIQNATAGIRSEVDFANINAIARVLSITVIVNAYMLFNSKNKKLYLGILLPIVALVSTQSRTSFITTIFGLLGLLLLNSIKRKKVMNVLFKLIVSLLVVYAVYKLLLKVPALHGIMGRIESLEHLLFNENGADHSSILRQEMIEVGLRVFKDNPLGGIGIGNSHFYTHYYLTRNTYLHNNYVELLASVGIIGFILYYLIYARLIIRLKKYSTNPDDINMMCIVLLASLLISDYGNVSYYFKEIYFFFIVCFVCTNISERNYYENRLEE